MAEVLLFHHAQGLTPGVIEFADALRAGGHAVHTPDLYEGRTFTTLEEGVGHAQSVGFDVLTERGVACAADLPAEVVHAGISLGVGPAQTLAQTRPGARGALLLAACLPSAEIGGPWPAEVPLQVHGMDGDPEFANEWDLPAARAVVAEASRGELFLYPGDQHLFMDASLPSYDAGATALLTERLLAFLAQTDR